MCLWSSPREQWSVTCHSEIFTDVLAKKHAVGAPKRPDLGCCRTPTTLGPWSLTLLRGSNFGEKELQILLDNVGYKQNRWKQRKKPAAQLHVDGPTG